MSGASSSLVPTCFPHMFGLLCVSALCDNLKMFGGFPQLNPCGFLSLILKEYLKQTEINIFSTFKKIFLCQIAVPGCSIYLIISCDNNLSSLIQYLSTL